MRSAPGVIPGPCWLSRLFLVCAIVLAACDGRPPVSTPITSQDLDNGYRLQRVKADPDNPGDVLVILTRGLQKEEDAHRLVAELSKIVYEERGK